MKAWRARISKIASKMRKKKASRLIKQKDIERQRSKRKNKRSKDKQQTKEVNANARRLGGTNGSCKDCQAFTEILC